MRLRQIFSLSTLHSEEGGITQMNAFENALFVDVSERVIFAYDSN